MAYICGVGDLALDLVGFAFVLFTAQREKMRVLLRTWVGMKDFLASSATPSRSSLWRAVTRPPQFQSRIWHMEKLALYLSQYWGRSRGSRPYRRKRASRHSCASSSVLFSVDGCTVSHAPVFVTLRTRHTSWTGAPARVSSSAYYALRKLRGH